MEEAALGAITAVAVALAGAVGVLLRRGNGNHNPNLATVDGKLNDILLMLTEIKTVLERCPVAREK